MKFIEIEEAELQELIEYAKIGIETVKGKKLRKEKEDREKNGQEKKKNRDLKEIFEKI